MDKESRKQQILKAACNLFASQGYSSTSLAQIAKQCSCSPSLIIRHFGSKENIYNALLDQLKDACRQPLISSIPSGTTMERLETLYNALVFEMVTVEDTHEKLLSALESRGGTYDVRANAMRHIQDVGTEILLPIIRDGTQDGTFPPDFPCEKAAKLLWLYISGSHMIRSNYPKMEPLPFSNVRRLLLEL